MYYKLVEKIIIFNHYCEQTSETPPLTAAWIIQTLLCSECIIQATYNNTIQGIAVIIDYILVKVMEETLLQDSLLRL